MAKTNSGPATLPTLLALAAARLASGLALRVLAPFVRRPIAAVPSKVLIAPETLMEGDARVAADIYAGVFALAGEVVDAAGRSPFVVPAPSEAWARALHGFAWLAHLEANATELSSTNARALLDDWLQARSERHKVAEHPEVMAERLASLLVQAPLLLDGSQAEFRARYMRTIARHMRRLERMLITLPHGPARLKVAATLALAGTAVGDGERAQRIGLAQLSDTVSAQILPDGGHRSRSPTALLAATAELAILREALTRRKTPVPRALSDALDRMFPMVRFLRHGDGSLALFHGSTLVPKRTVDAVLAYDDVEGEPLDNARYSGFRRLAADDARIVFDTGRPPSPRFAQAACASALAFELSHGERRVITNCGELGAARAEWQLPSRATAAHSTLVLDNTSSAKLMTTWPLSRLLRVPLYGGPHRIEVRREGHTVAASHDGYLAAFGITHRRRLALAEDGLSLTGEDRLTGQDRLSGRPYAIRFHLHPDAKARLDKTGRRAVISFPDGAIWVFFLDHGPALRLEESLVLSGARRARRSAQVVIAGDTLTDDLVRWHIGRHAAPLPAAASAEDMPVEAAQYEGASR